jgi:hypothetical protein
MIITDVFNTLQKLKVAVQNDAPYVNCTPVLLFSKGKVL